MLRHLYALVAALLLTAPGISLALAADPQNFTTEDSATKFCKPGNVVWFNPASKIYFEGGSQYYGKTKAGGGFTCRTFAEKAGYRAN